jgi:hypothetical protein
VRGWKLGVNVVALAAVILMIAAMFLPWWSFKLQFGTKTDIYPYLISGPASELIGYKRSPQMAALTGVAIVAIVLGLVGCALRGKLARAMLGIAGLLVLLAAWRFVARISSVAAGFEIPIQGHGIATYGGFSPIEVTAWLRPGLYMIVLGGALALIASLLNERVRLRF